MLTRSDSFRSPASRSSAGWMTRGSTLDGLVRNFVKVDLERGLTDYDHYAMQLQKYRDTWRTPLDQSSVTGHEAHHAAHHTRRPDSPARDDAESVNANISD